MRLYLLFIATFSFFLNKGQTKLDGYVHDEITHAPLKDTKITLSIIDSIIYDPNRLDSFLLVNNNYDSRYDTSYKDFKVTSTDSNGYYLFSNIPLSTYELSVFHPTKEIRPNVSEGEFYLKKNVKTSRDNTITNSFTLHVTCEYDQTKSLKHCPNCKKTDKVLLIEYGLFPPNIKPDPKCYYNGFCVIPRCHPTKHCTRCFVDF